MTVILVSKREYLSKVQRLKPHIEIVRGFRNI